MICDVIALPTPSDSSRIGELLCAGRLPPSGRVFAHRDQRGFVRMRFGVATARPRDGCVGVFAGCRRIDRYHITVPEIVLSPLRKHRIRQAPDSSSNDHQKLAKRWVGYVAAFQGD